MKNQTQIAILSTDKTLTKTLSTTLATAIFTVEEIKTPTLETLLIAPTDILIIDEDNLLNMSALDICKIIRLKNEEVIIIIITEKCDPLEKILALELGADDYLTKPVNHLEIMARIKVILRRTNAIIKQIAEDEEYKFNDLYLDAKRHLCIVGDSELKLTNHEFLTLLHLVQNKGKTVPRTTLLTQIWGLSSDEPTRPVDDAIRRLRKKLNTQNSTSQILAHWGHGYRIETGS